MDHVRLNRNFSTYVRTQSALVLVVLAASHILTGLLTSYTGMKISQMGVSFALVGLAQLPLAIMYARSEARTLTSREGWILAFIFVVLSVVVEFGLQLIAGQTWTSLSPVFSLFASGQLNLVVTGACGFFLGIIVAAFVFKTLFQLSIRNNLRDDEHPNEEGWLTQIPGVVEKSANQSLSAYRAKGDHTKTFRHMLFAANAGVIGLGLIVLGSNLSEILMLSIPLSVFFGVVCIANKMAKTNSSDSLVKRSWVASCKILPLTVTAFMLMGLSKVYSTHVAAKSQGFDLLAPVSSEMAAIPPTAMFVSIACVAAFFALCLAANAALLTLFSRLIQPLVQHPRAASRPQVRALTVKAGGTADFEQPKVTPEWTPKTAEILAVLARIKSAECKTPRPVGSGPVYA